MIGYARVSTSGQTVSMQREQLRAAGCTAIFGETASGASGHRVELARAMAALGEGDVLVVTRLDRLARSTRDLLEIVEDRYETGSLLITSQVPIDRWYDIIGIPTLADAVLDRVVHNAYRIELSGESLRKRKAAEPTA